MTKKPQCPKCKSYLLLTDRGAKCLECQKIIGKQIKLESES